MAARTAASTPRTTAASTPLGPTEQRLRAAGLLASTGTVGDALDNAMAESFLVSLQTELLDRQTWATREELATAVFDYVEAFYNPRRRHSALGYLSPNDHEHRHAKPVTAAAAAA